MMPSIKSTPTATPIGQNSSSRHGWITELLSDASVVVLAILFLLYQENKSQCTL
eukprot:m.332578 g.332578  ORF g.332578 m.332578 type:complete len:54 (+) comp16961_c0_seq1:3022-3183(+)